MTREKVAITLDESIPDRLDKLVRKRVFPNRSQAIEEAVVEKLSMIEKSRLAQECAKLEPAFEKALAEEGFFEELKEWNRERDRHGSSRRNRPNSRRFK
ncbi:MAG TPA: ribbon-helix-helix domain-containing protein [Candidatus Saccharimonadales bacterium]|nr:ribbon-helix-helix domain-containing protein [Candidatus Saccharimonadales bacterium]